MEVGHRGSCWRDGHTLCLDLVLAALISEVRENALNSVFKICALFLMSLDVGIRPNFNSGLRELN